MPPYPGEGGGVEGGILEHGSWKNTCGDIYNGDINEKFSTVLVELLYII